jgi:hypothetical protein
LRSIRVVAKKVESHFKKKDSKVNWRHSFCFSRRERPAKKRPQPLSGKAHTLKEPRTLSQNFLNFCKAGGFFQVLRVSPLNADGEMFAFATQTHTSSAAN